jgi:hypothetical protein
MKMTEHINGDSQRLTQTKRSFCRVTEANKMQLQRIHELIAFHTRAGLEADLGADAADLEAAYDAIVAVLAVLDPAYTPPVLPT